MSTYAQLQADFSGWAKRSDLDAQISTFVALFEAKAGRKLRTRLMESSFSGTIAAGLIALPADFSAFKALWPANYEDSPLMARTLETVVSQDRDSGIPSMYAVDGANVRFDGSGDVSGVYYAKIPSLSANGTNWLCTAAYDAYLFGALAEGSLYALDPQLAQVYAARSDMILNEIMRDDQRQKFNGPIAVRAK